MRCPKWLCREEKPTALGLLSKENKQLSGDMLKAYKIMKPVEQWERQMIIHYFSLCKN